jgi:hypothetical protein
MDMQYPSSLGKKDGALPQGTKRGPVDEHPQGASKAAKLGTTTNGNNMEPGSHADRYPPPLESSLPKDLVEQQEALKALRSNVVPGPMKGITKTNGTSWVPPPPNNNPGPVSTHASLQAPHGVQNVQAGSIARSHQSGFQQSGPHQSGPHHSSYQKSGPIPPGSRQPDSHEHNLSFTNGSGSISYAQAPVYGNATQNGHPIHQSGPNLQPGVQMGPLPSQPASSYPWIRDTRPLIHISESIAKLSNTKVRELLACAAMYHTDVLSTVQIATSEQRSTEI